MNTSNYTAHSHGKLQKLGCALLPFVSSKQKIPDFLNWKSGISLLCRCFSFFALFTPHA